MAGLLRMEDYPPQEPVTKDAAIAYRKEAMRRAHGVEGGDFAYGADIYQRIALFKPKKPNGTMLGWMHGGGWTSGFKEVMTFMAPAYLEAGVTFASIGYRLAPQDVFPAGAEDAADGVAWLHAHAREIGVDPGRIFIGGFSAGGHYAALLAVRKDWQAPRGLPQDVLKACLPVSGTYDFTPAGGLTPRPRFLGPDTQTDRRASPLYVMQGTPPPFLMASGTEDFPSIKLQAPRMEAALRAAGGECERIVFDGCDHFASSLATIDPARPWLARSLDWLARR